jgi:hypothetical protein
VADHVFVVLTDPPSDISWDEFDAWYDIHVREIVTIPGWAAAERFKLRYVDHRRGPEPGFSHYVRYEIDGDFDVAWQALRAAVTSGRLTLAAWHPRMKTVGWQGNALGERVVSST